MSSLTSEQPTPFHFDPASVYLLFKKQVDGETYPGVFFHYGDNKGILSCGDTTGTRGDTFIDVSENIHGENTHSRLHLLVPNFCGHQR